MRGGTPGRDESRSYLTGTDADRLVAEARRRFVAGRPQEAESILKHVIERNPRDLNALLALGIVAVETGRPEAAAERMARALVVDPNCVPAMCWMSHFALQSGRTDEARRYAEQAGVLEPQNPGTHAALGRALMAHRRFMAAATAFKRAAKIQPDHAATQYEFADALFQAGLEREAADALRRAVALAPETMGMLRLAHLELQYGRLDEAERLCREVLAREPELAPAHIILGRILTETFRYAEAEVHWARAQELDPGSGAILIEKALAYSASGEFERARAELRRSIETQPLQGMAYQGLVFSKRVTAEDRPLVRQMEDTLAISSLPVDEKTCLLYALGKAYDNLSEYETANGFFDLAHELNRGLAKTPPFDPDACRRLIDAKIELFSEARFQGSEDFGDLSNLPIAIVGMMRSGTTLAEQMLTCHPNIGGAGEQPYWVDHDALIANYTRQSIDRVALRACAQEYVALLSSISPGFSNVVDKNPANLQVLGSMHLALPNARIIHMRRNAIDTALSIWMTPMNTAADFVGDRESIVFAYKQFMRLTDHWRRVLPPNRFLEVRYEDLVAQPEVFGRRMVEFCGLEWDKACLHPELNQRRVITPSQWQVRQPISTSSVGRWAHYEPWLGAFEELKGL